MIKSTSFSFLSISPAQSMWLPAHLGLWSRASSECPMFAVFWPIIPTKLAEDLRNLCASLDRCVVAINIPQDLGDF